jgi:hypothetical protein
VTPRVFAYGGTSFNEQRRIGEWARLPMALCEDTQGLRGGLVSFGFGALADQRPFLIWRVLQNVESRGGYPFTLLLDPGDEVYERFQWNTGRLLAALFEEGDRVGRVLLEHAPSIKVEAVAEMLDALPTEAPRGSDVNVEAARVYWTAGALTDRVLTITPSRLSLAQRPSAAWIGSLQDRLPTGLRNSGGWLVAGDPTHAESIGARLALVDRVEGDAEASLDDARGVLAAVDRIPTLPQWTDALVDQWLDAPAWRNHEGLLRTRDAVAALDRPDALVDFAEALSDASERRQWTGGACATLLVSKHPHTERVTRFLLDQAFAGVCRLEARHYPMLDRPTVDHVLDARSIPPTAPPAGVGLPRNVLVERCRRHATDRTRRFSPDEYDAFGDDPAWETLRGTLAGNGDALRRIIDPLLERKRDDDLDRLRRLAQWTERRSLSPADRKQMANAANGPWTALVILDRLVGGDQSVRITRADSDVLAMLRDDLGPAVRTHRAGSPPNLAGLRALLGDIPRDALTALAALEPSLQETSEAQAWVDAWDGLDSDVHEKERERFAEQTRQRALEHALVGDYRNDQLPAPDALRALLTSDQPRLTRTIATWRAGGKPEPLNRVIRRFAASAPHLTVFLESLTDDQQQFISALVVALPPTDVDRALPLARLRAAVKTIRGLGTLGIILARAVLLAPDPPSERESSARSWWSRFLRK